MKSIRCLLVVAICLFFVGQAHATATYYSYSWMQVGFSHLWDYGDLTHVEDRDGTGEHSETIWYTSGKDEIDPEFRVGSHVEGSAGDAIGSLSGTSEAYITTTVIFDFVFDVATDFTITLLDEILTIDPKEEFPGESASADAFYDVLLDGQSILTQLLNSPVTNNLSSTHRVTLITHAEGSAEAIYDSIPEPSTFLLLGAGLAGVGLLRRRFIN